MVKMGKKKAYRFKKIAEDNGFENKVEQGYVEAFKKGYSAVEITRIVGVKSTKFIHAILVRNGLIKPGKPGRQIKGTIPDGMEAHLKIRGISFSQWCAEWSMDQNEAFDDINNRSGMAMAAIRVDFPKFYEILTGCECDDFVRPEPFEKHKITARIEWLPAEGYYKAEILDGFMGYGDDTYSALRMAQSNFRGHLTIKRLENLRNKNEEIPNAPWLM